MGTVFADIMRRIVALVVLKVSAVIGAGTVIGVELWQSATMAAVVALADIAQALSRAYLDDGRIDPAEVDAAFNKDADA